MSNGNENRVKVQCQACLSDVTHVDPESYMCDDCVEAYEEWLTMELEDMHANGMPNITLH